MKQSDAILQKLARVGVETGAATGEASGRRLIDITQGYHCSCRSVDIRRVLLDS